MSKINNLEMLAASISDMGHWTWWTEQLPGIFQVEFNGTQLFLKEREGITPSTQIAIQFINPTTVSFISKVNTSEKWYDLLHADKHEPLICSKDRFSFTDEDTVKVVMAEAVDINTIHGYTPSFETLIQEPISLAFWAGDHGLLIGSKQLQICTTDGVVPLRKIPEFHAKWWLYWEEYWSQKESANPLPYDPFCEVTIPLSDDFPDNHSK